MQIIASFLTLLAATTAAQYYAVMGRLGKLPFSMTQLFTGSYETAFGGFNIPRDSRIYALFAQLAAAWDSMRLNPARNLTTAAQLYYLNNSPIRQVNPNCTHIKGPITSIAELNGLTEPELECLLRKGEAPSSLQTGLYYGRVESWLGSEYLREFGEAFSGGTILAETKCDGLCPLYEAGSCQSRIKIGFTQAGLAAAAPSYNYIGPDEIGGLRVWHVDHIPGDWWWMDWSIDAKEICPSRVHRFYDTFTSTSMLNSLLELNRWVGGPGSSIVPAQVYTAGSLNNAAQLVRDRVAQLREIGQDQEMGCKIYLGRLLTLFPEGLRVTGFFSFAKLL